MRLYRASRRELLERLGGAAGRQLPAKAHAKGERAALLYFASKKAPRSLTSSSVSPIWNRAL